MALRAGGEFVNNLHDVTSAVTVVVVAEFLHFCVIITVRVFHKLRNQIGSEFSEFRIAAVNIIVSLFVNALYAVSVKALHILL